MICIDGLYYRLVKRKEPSQAKPFNQILCTSIVNFVTRLSVLYCFQCLTYSKMDWHLCGITFIHNCPALHCFMSIIVNYSYASILLRPRTAPFYCRVGCGGCVCWPVCSWPFTWRLCPFGVKGMRRLRAGAMEAAA